ncbi:MAG: DUF58 domain-containing protein [Clostridia bacterium]|nr:DUF58 domain-containing protein [Clostridia bacterium]
MLSEGFLTRLDAMHLALRSPAQGGAGGLRRSRSLGSSVEFSDFREYAPGDDLRRLDWNAYARFDRLFLKLFMEEQETQVNILLDASASMAERGKWETAQGLAQIFSYLALRSGDRVTLCSLGSDARRTPSLSGRADYVKAAAFLEGVRPEGETLLCRDIQRLPLRPGRGVTVLITDLMSPDGYEKALQSLLYRKQEITLAHVLSPWEMAPELEGMVRLVDSETGEAREIAVSGDLLTDYRRTLDAFLSGAEGFCHDREIAYIRLLSDLDMENEALRALSRAGLVG